MQTNSYTQQRKIMNTKSIVVALLGLCLSVGAYAQQQTGVYKVKPRRSPEERAAHHAQMKEKLAHMSPAERNAFKKAHHDKRQARLNAMTPEQRARFMDRHPHGKRNG